VVAGAGLVLVGSNSLGADSDEKAPPFTEVYNLVRSNLAGSGEAELNRAAVEGFLTALAPKVSLLTNNAGANSREEVPITSKPNLLDREIAYLRVGRVDEGLARQVRDQYQALAATNQLKGIVLDLRYAEGSDYASAAAVADLFVKKERSLLNWGNGLIRSHEKGDAIILPLAVLVNRQTSHAAEALAAVLREVGAGLILGSRTAGQAMITKEFPLSNGEQIRIATATVEVGDSGAFPLKGLTPDITVEVSPEDERAYYADAFKVISSSGLFASANLSLTNALAGTNRASRRTRFNEAELVRERREGATPDSDTVPERGEEPEIPVVHDPVLARAMDLLKGLAVVRHSRF